MKIQTSPPEITKLAHLASFYDKSCISPANPEHADSRAGVLITACVSVEAVYGMYGEYHCHQGEAAVLMNASL